MQEQLNIKQPNNTFEQLLGQSHKQRKLSHDFELLLFFHVPEQLSNKQFTKQLAEKYLDSIIKTQLGKIGLAKYTYQVVRVLPFDKEALIEIKSLSIDQFCMFWSTIAFNSTIKIELKQLHYKPNQFQSKA